MCNFGPEIENTESVVINLQLFVFVKVSVCDMVVMLTYEGSDWVLEDHISTQNGESTAPATTPPAATMSGFYLIPVAGVDT